MSDAPVPPHFSTNEDFEDTIDALYQRASRLEKEELEDFAAAEQYIQQSYEGRSLFELIQNGRDAAQLTQQPGLIELELTEQADGHWLLVRNSGQPFTPAGVAGITRIGQSTKADAKTIGFKGIGFKAVRQLTDHPRVVTRWGTLLFDTALTRHRYLAQWAKPAPAALPLFRLPHYLPEGLTPAEVARGIATRVELPLRNEEARTLVADDLAKLTARQLVLLGMVRQLTIRTPASTTDYVFESRSAGRLDVWRNGRLTEQYRQFEPTAAVTFPAELLQNISPEEREIMARMTQVDIRLLLLLDGRSRFVAQTDAPLYLFYPLRLVSGFRFLIHSFFLVDPARTTLRPQSRPNEFLLQQIGRFIGGELVTKLKAGGYDTTEILCYQRASPQELAPLYNEVQGALREVAFISLPRADKKPRYLRPAEVMCATSALASLLPSGQVAERWLVPIDDQAVRRWLRTEFSVPELTSANLGQQLELECERQAGNSKFFQRLYQFLAADKVLDLKAYRVLLTQQKTLVAGAQQTVFYRTATTARVSLTKPLQRQVHLLHEELQLTDPQLKALEARTGLREMDPDALATRLLGLMADEQLATLRPSILQTLKELAQGSERALGWFPRVWLPVQGGHWRLPLLNQPVYLERAELRELYPQGQFIDRAAWPQLAGDEAEWDAFLLQVGAWDKPGLYLNSEVTSLLTTDSRNEHIRAWKPWSTTLFFQYDRLLHVPAQPTEWFTQQLLTRWAEYRAWLGKPHNKPLLVGSQQSEWHQAPTDRVPQWCGAMQWLRTAKWVVLPGQLGLALAIAELVGIAPGSSPDPRLRLTENFLPVWRLDPDQHQGFITALRLAHLQTRHLTGRLGMNRLRQVLQLTTRRHSQPATLPAPDFENFYNMLLSRLQAYWEEITDAGEQKESLASFRNLPWLARHGDAGPLSWQPASQLLYLDDKPAYERLLSDLQAQPALLAQLPAQFYYQFTKRDAQGFGRLAQHLGQSFTSLVRRTLQQVPTEAPEPLLTSQLVKPDLLLRLIALLEGHRNRQFTPAELARLRVAQVVTSPVLLVAFRLAFARGAQSVDFELEQPYYLARPARAGGGSTLYRQAAADFGQPLSVLAQRHTVEALAALLAQVLDANIQYLRQTLLSLFSAGQLTEFYLVEHLSPDRLAELRTELYPPLETPEGAFWQAIRRALSLSVVSPGAAAQPAPVAELLVGVPFAEGSPLPTLLGQAFAGGDLPQSANTRVLLQQLLQETGLSVAALNTELVPPILFESLLNAEWEAVRKQYRPTFMGRLHAGLSDRPAEQMKYQRYLAQYEQLSRPTVPHEWQPDHRAQLAAACARDFASLLAGASLKPPHDANSQYERTLNALRISFGQTADEAEQLGSFLQVPSRRSLLFFGQQQKLATEYAAWLRSRQAADTANNPTADATPPVNPAGFGQAVGQLVAPAPRQRTTGGGGGGGAAGSRESQQARDRIGRRAEERAWVWLREQGYQNVTWVSANAQKVAVNHPAHNANGSDEHHYDLHYLNEAGEQVAVEVKGTSGQTLEFYLSQGELAFAERQLPGRYRLLFITQAPDNEHCRLYALENPFLYKGQESRWHNTRFRAEADTVRVSFLIGS